MLNSIKFKTKRIFCCMLLTLGIIASAFTGMFQVTKTQEVLAQSSNKIVEDVTSSVLGSGYNFNVTTSDSPVKPSGWTSLDSESSNSDIIKGVVNANTDTTFDTDECKTVKPPLITNSNQEPDKNSELNKHLMINAHNGPGKMGYKRNSTISLEDNSFYRIGVKLLTQKTNKSENQAETDARASIYLTGLLEKDEDQYKQTKYEYFSTLGAWEEYFFYIDTNEKETINIELWLGSKTSTVTGAVFFNEVSVIRYSEDSYLEQTQKLDDTDYDNFNIISLRETLDSPVDNGNFEDVSLDGWSRKSQSTSDASEMTYKSVDVNTFSKVNDDLIITAPGSNCSVDNQNALFLYNKVDGYQALESSSFTVERQTYYRLSFWAKSNCNTGKGATVMLVDKSDEEVATTASLTLATTFTKDSNKFRNDWTKYNFYIYGPAVDSKEVSIQIWLGTQSTPTSGYAFIDDFRIDTIDYATYSANTSSSNSTTFNLNNADDKYTISNSDFNKTENETALEFYPAKPSGWTRTGDTNTTTISGIINGTEDAYASIDFGNAESLAPEKIPALTTFDSEDNNVLMIGSSAETNTQTFTSNSISMSANSYYSLSFYVMTDYARNSEDSNYGARVTIRSSTTTIFDYYNIYFTDGGWHKIVIKVKTGNNAISPTVALSFENTRGFVFFDKVELRTITETTYNDRIFSESDDAEYHKVDLSTETFDNHNYNNNQTNINGIETPNNWKINSNNSNAISGIISADNDLISEVPESLTGDNNYLYISSLSDVNSYYTSNESYSFSSSTYYKISVDVLTRFINRQEDPEEDVNYGAFIDLGDSTEIRLTGINTNGVWKTYTIYASFISNLSSTISLGLGYADDKVSGEVLFDNVVISTTTQDAYKTEILEAEDNTFATFIDYTEPEAEAEKDTTTPWTNEVNWLVLPSILTALAIIIAVVGYYVRKITFNRRPKIKTNYDRRKTLDRDIDRREKIALRQQIIDELRNELKNIDKEIEDFNVIANNHLEEIKEEIRKEQEVLEKAKLEIEIKKKEATANREKQLKESAELVSDKKAEKQYNSFIVKLDRQEMAVQRKINAKELKIATAAEINKEKLSKYLERQEYIKLQIAKIEAEIEEIAKQEEEIWAEYRAAKAEAKRQKAEYKAQVKAEKEKTKKAKANSTKKPASSGDKPKATKKSTSKKEIKKTDSEAKSE